MGICTCHSEHVKVRGQLLGLLRFSHYMGFRMELGSPGMGAGCLYLLDYFTGPRYCILKEEKGSCWNSSLMNCTSSTSLNPESSCKSWREGPCPHCSEDERKFKFAGDQVLQNLWLGARTFKGSFSQSLTDTSCHTSSLLHWVLGIQCAVAMDSIKTWIWP